MIRLIKDHWKKYLILIAGVTFAWWMYLWLVGWGLLLFALALTISAVYILKRDVAKYVDEYLEQKRKETENNEEKNKKTKKQK